MSQPVDFYFDFISPYAYIGSTQIEALAARHGRTVNWRPVLIGVTVMKIMGMKPLPETPLKGDYLRHDAPRMAEIFGVPFKYHGLEGHQFAGGVPRLPVAQAAGRRRWPCALRIASSRRLWVEGRDITPAESVAEEAARARRRYARRCLRRSRATQASRRSMTAVDHAIKVGAFGVPYFVADGEPIWGCDRLWMLEHWLAHGTWEGARARPCWRMRGSNDGNRNYSCYSA